MTQKLVRPNDPNLGFALHPDTERVWAEATSYEEIHGKLSFEGDPVRVYSVTTPEGVFIETLGALNADRSGLAIVVVSASEMSSIATAA
jgi:hypothetical protein